MKQASTIMRCPVCRAALCSVPAGAECENGHHYDRAKEGYVNLLIGHKPGTAQGDSREMARSRRAFLESGYFEPLAEGIKQLLRKKCPENGTVMDICCGEGYYTAQLARDDTGERSFFGFDLSRDMVRLASKRKCAEFFVANLASVPVHDDSVDFAFHLFAPFNSREFARILKPDGTLVSVIPGRRHLMGLKEILYASPYENNETPPKADGLRLSETERIRVSTRIEGQENIQALLRMTPYFYHTPSAGLKRLEGLDSLQTELDFILLCYQKAQTND